jgi:prepilin-type N-terminal cleavage/methylation domain-containing protein
MNPELPKRTRQNTQGFSLLEMLMVLAVVAILAAIGFANYAAYARSVRMREVNNQIAQLFQDTSARAINSGKSFTINFALNQTTGIDLTVIGDGETRTIALENDAALSNVQDKIGARSSITFNARGRREGNPSTLIVGTRLGALTGTVRLLFTGKTVVQ